MLTRRLLLLFGAFTLAAWTHGGQSIVPPSGNLLLNDLSDLLLDDSGLLLLG